MLAGGPPRHAPNPGPRPPVGRPARGQTCKGLVQTRRRVCPTDLRGAELCQSFLLQEDLENLPKPSGRPWPQGLCADHVSLLSPHLARAWGTSPLPPARPPLLCRGGCDLLGGAKLTGLQPLVSTPGFQPEGFFWKIYPTVPVRVVLKHGIKVKHGPVVLLFLVEGVCT